MACSTCHAGDNGHQGQFSTDCGSCHSIGAWLPAVHAQTSSDIADCAACHRDSSAHNVQSSVACGSCHGTTAWRPATHAQDSPNISSVDCAICHEADSGHQGQFSSACGSCHGSGVWTPAIFDHAQSNFPLTGRHQSTNCAQCHVNNQYNIDSQCVSCHQGDDDHNGQYGTSCESCHSTADWEAATFDHVFRLKDEHKEFACAKCHTNNNNMQQFTCLGTCHTRQEMDKEHKDENGYSYNSERCASCHAKDGGDDDDDDD